MWLKVLEQSHKGKIDVIYIDPPYNTGNKDFVYNDTYTDANESFFHSKWLDFISRRLHIANKLLSDEGVIFISIDDREYAYLKVLCDELFGVQNFIASVVVTSNSSKNNAKFIGVIHEFVLCYAKNIELLPDGWRVKKNNVDEYVKRARYLVKQGLSQDEIHNELLELTKRPRFYDFDHFTYADEQGIYQTSDLTAPGSKLFYPIYHPVTHKAVPKPSRGWSHTEDAFHQLIINNEILFGEDESSIPRIKRYLDNYLTQIPQSVVFFDSQGTTKWVKSLGLDFPFPKAVALIKHVLSMYPKKDITVMDFFAGSGVTAHAVAELNAEDGGNRRWILVTNNEGETDDDPSTGIMHSVTKPRIDTVLTGIRPDGTRYSDGTGNGYDFFTYDLEHVGRPSSYRQALAMCGRPAVMDGYVRIRYGVGKASFSVDGDKARGTYASESEALSVAVLYGNLTEEYVTSTMAGLPDGTRRILVIPDEFVDMASDATAEADDIEVVTYSNILPKSFLK